MPNPDKDRTSPPVKKRKGRPVSPLPAEPAVVSLHDEAGSLPARLARLTSRVRILEAALGHEVEMRRAAEAERDGNLCILLRWGRALREVGIDPSSLL